jgi:DNA polymerase alpha subunit B
MPPLKSPSLGQTKLKIDPGVSDEPFSVYIACGPYTFDADLSYTPWHAFLKTIKTKKPTVVLLVGSSSRGIACRVVYGYSRLDLLLTPRIPG